MDGEQPARVRAAKACKRCNQKRVRCDVMDKGYPCSRCRKGGHSDCELVDSRRGRYSRDAARSQRAGVPLSNADSVESAPQDEVVPPVDTAGRQSSTSGSVPAPILDLTRGAEGGPPSEAVNDRDISNGTGASHTPAYREISWSGMFSHFLDGRLSNKQDIIDKCSITYLGESFPLALVLNDLQEGGAARLHHAGPRYEDSQTPRSSTNPREYPPHLLPEDINCLESKQAFEKPPLETFEALMRTFVDTVFPVYPIVNLAEFLDQYQQDSLPWILLHSSCFAAATFCSISTIHRAGFAGRRQARFAYYRKAKALFDTGHESNKVVLLQSITLLTMWGGGPNAYWNFYTWISAGVTLAEALGIHRSMSGTNMDSRDRSLLKRLWWTLVVRDAFCASLVGRPLRVNLEHSDADMLTASDFEHDRHCLKETNHPLHRDFVHYQIQVANLSQLLHRIIYTRFAPGPKNYLLPELLETLYKWRDELPSNMDRGHGNESLLTSCLSVLYDHHIILATLGSGNSGATFQSDGRTEGQNAGEAAAQRILTLVSPMVVRSRSLSLPHEVFQGVFLAGVTAFTQMSSSQAVLAQLGRANLNTCEMIMHDIDEAWDPSMWVCNLFNKLTSRAAKQSNTNGVNSNDESLTNMNGDMLYEFDELGIDLGNPMFNELFDWSQILDDPGSAG